MAKDFTQKVVAKTTTLALTTEKTIKDNIKVLQTLKLLIPDLTSDEVEQLEQNILKNGILDPLTLWETYKEAISIDDLTADEKAWLDTKAPTDILYILVDGHNRYALSQQHKLDFKLNYIKEPNLQAVKDYMINYQLGRRNLTPEQVSYLRGLRYLTTKKSRGGDNKQSANVAQQLAEEFQVSTATIKRDANYAKGVDKLPSTIKKDVLSGKSAIQKQVIETLAKDNSTIALKTPADVKSYVEALTMKSGSEQNKAKQAKSDETDVVIQKIIHSSDEEKIIKEIKGYLQEDLMDISTVEGLLKKLQSLMKKLKKGK